MVREMVLRKITIWSLIGSLWTALFLCILAVVTIPDAPWNYPFWEGLMKDPTCYYHELWVIVGTWLAGLAIILVTRFWMALASFLESIESLLVLPDGKVAVVRRKKKKGV